MKCIEDIQIPLMSVPPPESCRLVRWTVAEGSHVVVGQVIFELDVDGEVFGIENFHTGFIRFSMAPGSCHQAGDVIGSVLCEKSESQIVGVEVSSTDLARIDALRGKVKRIDCLSALLGKALDAEEAGGSNH